MTKAKAMQHESASRLSILGYLSVVTMFTTDYFVVGTQFKLTELIGISIVLTATLVSALIIFRKVN